MQTHYCLDHDSLDCGCPPPMDEDLIISIGVNDIEIKEEVRNTKRLQSPLNPHGQPINRNFSIIRLTNRTIDELIGLCKGIQADEIVNEDEVHFLAQWLDKSREVINVWPVNVLASRIEKILEDNIIDDNEKKELLGLLYDITGCIPEHELINYATGEIIENLSHMSTLLPLDKPTPSIIFDGKQFCLTGKFCYGTRNKCEEEIKVRGGQTQSNITQKTAYLVIGLLGSTDWKHSTHGLKIKTAIELRDKGWPVSIVSEEHWVKHL